MPVAALSESTSQTLFVVPRGEGNGFRASVRGHVLDLIDPDSYSLAPTADDLFVVSLAAASAWAARSFLRDRSLPDYVSVAAERRTHEDPASPWDITLTITVSERAEAEAAALAAAVEKSLAPRLTTEPAIRVSFDGGDRERRTR
jgi:uncharacterized OsmC-like protein